MSIKAELVEQTKQRAADFERDIQFRKNLGERTGSLRTSTILAISAIVSAAQDRTFHILSEDYDGAGDILDSLDASRAAK